MPWLKVEADVLKVQMRLRVFWCCYNLDRAVAVTLGRPVGIADSDIDVEVIMTRSIFTSGIMLKFFQLPCDIDDDKITVSGLLGEPRYGSEPPTTVSSAIHTVRLRQLWARIQASMYPQNNASSPDAITSSILAEGFKTDLQDWLNSAPDQLVENRRHNNAYASHSWFQLMFHHSILLIHRHRLVTAGRGEDKEYLPSSVYLDCASSAQSICHLYRQLYISHRLNDTWGALHVLFLGGVTFLHCLWMSPEVRAEYRLDKVATTCTSCIVVLAVMAERWSAVQSYRDAYDMLSGATQAMLAESLTAVMPPELPVFATIGHDYEQISDYLSSMAEIGMCPSVEALLQDMIAQ